MTANAAPATNGADLRNEDKEEELDRAFEGLFFVF
jgi:hypothetical protein